MKGSTQIESGEEQAVTEQVLMGGVGRRGRRSMAIYTTFSATSLLLKRHARPQNEGAGSKL